MWVTSKNKEVTPLVNQRRSLSQIKQSASKRLKVWTRNNPPNLSHGEVESFISQLPDMINYLVVLRHRPLKTGDLSVTKNPDQMAYYVTETYSCFGIDFERFLKGFCYDSSDQNPKGTVVQSAREEQK